MFLEIILFGIGLLWYYFHLKLRRLCRAFDKTGIKYIKPYLLFGNLFGVIRRTEHVATAIERIQKQFPNEKFVGLFNFMEPIILVQDLDVIRDVTVKDFSHFYDHSIELSNDVEPLFGRSLPNLKGHIWREMRSTLSPAFTSSKMRNMYGFMIECARQMTSYYEDACRKIKKDGAIEMESRDMISRFANDVIASTAFGLKVDSLQERDNEFYKMGQEISYISVPKFLGFMTYPKLMNLLRINIVSKYAATFFKTLVSESMKRRDENNIYRPDMIHLLMEAKKGTLKDDEAPSADSTESELLRQNIKTSWTDDDFAAQAMVFFLAGFEAATISSSFLFHTLTSIPEIQDKLYQEILETKKKHNDNITYEVLHSMKYMDMFISEILRRWPSGSAFIDRCCTEDYVLPPVREGAKRYQLKKGSKIWISTSTVHNDSRYWSKPDKFIPERFSAENKDNILPFSYIPFGIGPRMCIGNRFVLMELKVLAFYCLEKFQIVKSPKSHDHFELEPTSLNIRVKGGVWFKLKLREN